MYNFSLLYCDVPKNLSATNYYDTSATVSSEVWKVVLVFWFSFDGPYMTQQSLNVNQLIVNPLNVNQHHLYHIC